jgi:F420-dependent oxidoreductase-like protein
MVEGQEGVSWDEWVALARTAETTGLEGLFRSDHYSSFHNAPGAALDAWATIAALAAITDRIRLGTLVSAATFRHPSELARVAVTADHVSGGRIDVGIGAGWFEPEHHQNGFGFPPVADRFDLLTEYVEILIRSWTADTFDFRGNHFVLRNQQALPAPLQMPHPPVIIGGRGRRRSLELAARLAQEYNGSFLAIDDCHDLRRRLDAACLAVHRDPKTLGMSLMTLVALGDHGDEAHHRLTSMLTRFRGPRDRCHAGTVEEMTTLLRGFEAAGVTRVYLQHPDRQDLRAVQLIGELAAGLAS